MSLDDLDKDLAAKQLAGFWASNITSNDGDGDGDVIEPRTTVPSEAKSKDAIAPGIEVRKKESLP